MEGPQPTISKLRFLSMGIVAINKPLKTKIIEVSLAEELFMLDGELTDNVEKWKTKSYEADNKTVYEEEIEATVTVKATWLPMGSNRVTAPDVRRGEVVSIYQMGDTDKYYWTSLKYDMRLRKLETVIFAISGTRVEPDEGTSDNTYFVEWSTHAKHIRLHTSKADGEPFAYDIEINTKDGSMTFQDDAGNYIFMDSANNRLELKNGDGSWFDMDRKNVTVTVPDTYKVIAKKIIHQAPNVETQAANSKITGKLQVGSNVTVKQLTSAENIVAPNV